MGADLRSDRPNLPVPVPLSSSLSDHLALKLNSLTDLEGNQNQFAVGAWTQSRPPRALEVVTSPRCGIDILTHEIKK